MLIALVVATLVALLVGQALPRAVTAAPALWAHIALAIGVMTLITAAMQHFVPVLARTRGVGRWMGRLPWLMLAAGGLATATFAGAFGYIWIAGAAGLALLGTALMLAWMLDRVRRALGRPHPGLYWYVAALACLAAGLLAAVAIPLLQQWHGELRAFHLHINLYGFVALTAVGTLQVLMPTAAGKPDPGAGARLRVDLKWALAGRLVTAMPAAIVRIAWQRAGAAGGDAGPGRRAGRPTGRAALRPGHHRRPDPVPARLPDAAGNRHRRPAGSGLAGADAAHRASPRRPGRARPLGRRARPAVPVRRAAAAVWLQMLGHAGIDRAVIVQHRLGRLAISKRRLNRLSRHAD